MHESKSPAISAAAPKPPSIEPSGPLLAIKNIKKTFGHIRALNGVSFTVDRAAVVALLGDNGAGKSTLIRILNGIYAPDEGEILWNGHSVQLQSPRDAAALGFATVYQDLAMVDQLSIYRNMFLGREESITWQFGPFRFIDHARAKRESSEALAALGIEIRSTETSVEALSGGQRQSIAIARAVHFGGELLILDEPTSALSLRQTKQVLQTIEKARERGTSVLLISHNVYHVFEVADRFVVLSHGETVGNFARGEADVNQVSSLIVHGRAVER
jgi:simple sugar transport system ATP-binding protein